MMKVCVHGLNLNVPKSQIRVSSINLHLFPKIYYKESRGFVNIHIPYSILKELRQRTMDMVDQVCFK